MQYSSEIKKAADILKQSTNTAASCGAGFSAESGIDTFRDAGGIWDQMDPGEVGTVSGLVNTLQKKADRVMPIFTGLLKAFLKADPNPGHKSLVDLEKMGILKTILTQNVDNLHQEAGSGNVLEVHGNLFRMACLSCYSKTPFDRKKLVKDLLKKISSMKSYSLESFFDLAPVCSACGGVMRPDVVMFGEAVHSLPQAGQAARSCDVMLVLGTSGMVYPAAAFPLEAKNSGAKIIVINPTENPFRNISDVYIPLKTGKALPEIIRQIKRG